MVSEFSEELPSILFTEEELEDMEGEDFDDVDPPEYVEESDWEDRVERHWFPGPK